MNIGNRTKWVRGKRELYGGDDGDGEYSRLDSILAFSLWRGVHIALDEVPPSKSYVLRSKSAYYRKTYGYFVLVDDEFYAVIHRVGHPAIYPKGIISDLQWFLNGYEYTNVRHYCQACGFTDEVTVIWVLKYGESLPTTIDQL